MQSFLIKHRIADKTIAVGVSGGADSLALVLMAKEELAVYGYRIIALTVNHQLRPSAATEAEYVAKIMAEHNIEHHILVWQGEKPERGVEEAAREARYNLILQWCKANEVRVLMLAHHLDDQAETFLMRLQRGSGLEGLSCMREVTNRQGVTILRPLLGRTPDELRNYLKRRNIKWVEDESNTDTQYLRNKIRVFLPIFAAHTGITPRCLAATAERLQSAEDFIEKQVAEIMETQVQMFYGGVFCFKYTDFLHWHAEMKFRILANLCRRNYIPRAERVLRAVTALGNLPFNGTTLGEKEIFAAYGKVWIVPELHAKRKASRQAWKDFVLQNQQYRDVKIPHKARVAILEAAEG